MRMYNEDVDVKNIRHIFFITTTEKRNDFFPPPPFKKIFFEIKFSTRDFQTTIFSRRFSADNFQTTISIGAYQSKKSKKKKLREKEKTIGWSCVSLHDPTTRVGGFLKFCYLCRLIKGAKIVLPMVFLQKWCVFVAPENLRKF